ncbi:MsnO8 family LLM class oxidoreductase [Nonomuraea salmonea]|uniref:MsnO8 family LLM class oxidoreductase n=1 Tax=Nonomuraea salmonea TaxID=46181 RepID=UPI002FEB0D7F
MTAYSILDRSLVRRGSTPAEALRATVRFAGQAEELGYHRFWVSEHHSVPGVAGSAPTVLAAAVAAATSRIRVGTGGVMLPNHRPLVVAEEFGVLESLHPGRIDMGLGRSVGFTGGIRKALGHGKDDADRFGEQLAELLGFFTGGQSAYPGVHALPAEGLRPQVFVLAMGGGRGDRGRARAAHGDRGGLAHAGRGRPLPRRVPSFGVGGSAVRDGGGERGGRREHGGGGAAAAARGVGDGALAHQRGVPAADPGRGGRGHGAGRAGAGVPGADAEGADPRHRA